MTIRSYIFYLLKFIWKASKLKPFYNIKDILSSVFPLILHELFYNNYKVKRKIIVNMREAFRHPTLRLFQV